MADPPDMFSEHSPKLVCPDLFPISPNEGVTYDRTGTGGSRPVGTVATLSCADGYYWVQNSGAVKRTCQSNGQWTGSSASCGVPCVALMVLSGMVCYNVDIQPPGFPGTRATGIIATINCNAGYTLVGPSTRTCQSDGTWSGREAACQMACPDLTPPANGAVVYSDPTLPRAEGSTATCSCDTGYVEGTLATHSCAVGYALSGGTERTCQSNRTWSGGNVTCVASCSNLTLDNGMIVYSTNGFPILAGVVATHSFSDGYQLSGDVTRTCMSRPSGGRVWGGSTSVCRCDYTTGYPVAIAMILVTSLTVIITLVIIVIVRARQLQTARTQPCRVCSNKQQIYEDTSKMDVGGAGDHTHTPAMELSQCPAYAPTEVTTDRGRRGD